MNDVAARHALAMADGSGGVNNRSDSQQADLPRARALSATRAFAGTKDQVRRVRKFVTELVADWPGADDAILCASELAANAVVHSASGTPGGTFWVHLTAVPGAYIRIEVCDQGGPWLQREHDAERPHGLDLLRRLADCLGVEGDAASGRIVWTRLNLSRPGAPTAGDDLATGSELALAGFALPDVNGHARRADCGSPWPG